MGSGLPASALWGCYPRPCSQGRPSLTPAPGTNSWAGGASGGEELGAVRDSSGRTPPHLCPHPPGLPAESPPSCPICDSSTMGLREGVWKQQRALSVAGSLWWHLGKGDTLATRGAQDIHPSSEGHA